MKRTRLSTRSTRVARGTTLTEVMAGTGCAVALAALAMPLLGAVSSDSAEARSASNLRILAAANDAYSATFAGRQYTAIPEDAGLVNGNCTTYLATIACPPPSILGTSPSGATWGYFLGLSGLCASSGSPGSCGNWIAYKPFNFTGTGVGFGSFRLPNAKAFNAFVDGKFYSDTFYSPSDVATRTASAPYRDAGVDFDSAGGIAFSSYCFSPAAMMNPATLAASGYKAQESYTEGFVSPTVATCTHPDLKTRMIEHNWSRGAPSTANPNIAGGDEPWYFNMGVAASTQSIFFDGRVARVLTGKAVADDAAAQASSGIGLWHRGTPLGANGYFGQLSADGTRNSHTILTIDGILGRDVLTAQ